MGYFYVESCFRVYQMGLISDKQKMLLKNSHKCIGYMYQFRFPGNCPPTTPLTQHFALSESVNNDLGEG